MLKLAGHIDNLTKHFQPWLAYPKVRTFAAWIEHAVPCVRSWRGTCAMLSVAFAVIASPASGSIPNTYVAIFEFGSAELTESGRALVRAVVEETTEALSHTDAIVIYVSGYADTSGPEDFNMRLSKRRAEAIADALLAAGIERKRLEVSWHGEHELPVPTPDGVREQANRSVLASVWGWGPQ